MITDISIVACRRPELLEKTLRSFHENVFSGLHIRHAFINIDPFFGSEEDEARCIEIVKSHFRDPVIRTPPRPSFGGAVKWLWSNATDEVMLHLEDDWVCNHPFDIDEIGALFDIGYSAVVPLTRQLGWNQKYPYLTRSKPVELFGMRLFTRKIPFLGTSPKFIKSDFARKLSDLLIADLDPEKQQKDAFNKDIVALTGENRCAVIHGPSKQPLITDIGREWREERNIEKIVSAGKSHWKSVGTD